MYNNNTMLTNTTNENAKFILPEVTDDVFTDEDLADDYDGIKTTFRRVKIPSGGSIFFELPSDDPENPESSRTIEGIILFNHAYNAYWAGSGETNENTPPLCVAPAGKTGYGTPGGCCEFCAMNQFNTGIDSKGNPSKGKACKNMRQLYILRSGECMPILLSLPPTSIHDFGEFMNAAFRCRNRPSWASVVQIGLKRMENGSNPYSVATFKRLYDISGEDLMKVKAYAKTFKEQIQRSIQEPPMFTESVVRDEGVYGSDTIVIDGDRDALPQ